MRYDENLVRSAMAPDTIVAAVAANTTWKNQLVLCPVSLRKKASPIPP